jgi:hypothetical protein
VNIDGYEIMLNCIVVPILAILKTDLSFVYSPGIPTIFQQNYRIATTFLTSINFEPKCAVLLQSEFKKKFNLNTYFTLVFMETTSSYLQDLDEAFDQGRLKEGNTPASEVVWNDV